MEDEKKSKNAKRRPFKQTKQLVRMALNDGWTQKSIAAACRTHQSIVSDWNNGAKYGHEDQLMPLLEQYGHKIRRNAFRLYWNIDPETGTKSYHRVEGTVILSEAFSEPRRQHAKLIKKIPVRKLVVHHQGKGRFRVVEQSRIQFTNTNEELESSHEDAIWVSTVTDQFDEAGLIEYVDRYKLDELRDQPGDGSTLMFLIRKALLIHGFYVDGVVEYPAVW